MELFDNNFVNTTGEKVLVVQKNFNYPNWKMESFPPLNESQLENIKNFKYVGTNESIVYNNIVSPF